jgi:hypothetical protein
VETRPKREASRLLQARLPARLVKELRIVALEQETTVKDILARLIEQYLAEQRRGRPKR